MGTAAEGEGEAGDSLSHLLLSPVCPQGPEVSCEEWHSCAKPQGGPLSFETAKNFKLSVLTNINLKTNTTFNLKP